MVDNLPEEGEFVIGSVYRVEAQGAYVNLLEYDGQRGFVHIAEVSSGWVKNIRNYIRENQKVVCKVMRVRADRGRIDLSLKQVSGYRKQEKIRAWKNEQKASKLLERLISGLELDQSKLEPLGHELKDRFGTLYAAFEAVAIDEEALAKEKFEGEWISEFIQTAKKNISPPYVSIEGYLQLTTHHPEGINFIKQALSNVAATHDEAKVEIQYAGAPRYRLTVSAPDYKIAESQLENTLSGIKSSLKAASATIDFERS